MGDVLTLIEKAEQAVEQDEQEAMEQRLLQGQFTFDDFLASSRMLKKMGPLKGVMKLMPGMGGSSTTSTSTTGRWRASRRSSSR